MTDLLAARRRVGGDERRGRDDLPGRAETALERVGANERLDQGVVAKALDRRYLPLDRVDEGEARQHRDAVELDGAGAAVAFVAGNLRPRQPELVAEHLGEGGADLGLDRVPLTVDAKLKHQA